MSLFDLHFAAIELVHLVWAAAALVGLVGVLEARGRARALAFVGPALAARLVRQASRERRGGRLAAFAACLLLGVGALMRPQTPAARVVVAGRVAADVLVLLDVSRSMLAEDVAPNRLERAKAEIADLARELAGHRVGLVAFAGRSSLVCPLTGDLGFFRVVLDAVTTSSAGRGGTRIGDALRRAVGSFPEGAGAKIVVLFTDGEDHDSYPLEAAKLAAREGVRVVAIGFGDEQGSEIILTDPKTGARRPLLDSAGAAVRSRLDGETLRQIVLATGGVYVPAGVAALDLSSIVRTHIEPMVSGAGAAEVRYEPGELYPWFVLASLLALVAAVWLGRVPPTPLPSRDATPRGPGERAV